MSLGSSRIFSSPRSTRETRFWGDCVRRNPPAHKAPQRPRPRGSRHVRASRTPPEMGGNAPHKAKARPQFGPRRPRVGRRGPEPLCEVGNAAAWTRSGFSGFVTRASRGRGRVSGVDGCGHRAAGQDAHGGRSLPDTEITAVLSRVRRTGAPGPGPPRRSRARALSVSAPSRGRDT